MLMCTLLTWALCADPAVPAAISFGDLTAPIVWRHVQTRTCMEIGTQPSGRSGDAAMEFSYSNRRPDISIGVVRINLAAYRWPNMTVSQAAALRGQYRAALWHEIGHVLTARTSIADAQAAGLRGSIAFMRVEDDQNAYDDATEHGVRQDTIAPPLRGENTIVDCTPNREAANSTRLVPRTP
jgi:hypothetical protein